MYGQNIVRILIRFNSYGIDAIENAGRLKRFHNETKGTKLVERCNPSTDVDKLVTRIIKDQRKL